MALAACAHGNSGLMSPVLIEGNPVHGIADFVPADTAFFIGSVNSLPEAMRKRSMTMGTKSLQKQLGKLIDEATKELEHIGSPSEDLGTLDKRRRHAMKAQAQLQIDRYTPLHRLFVELSADGGIERFGLSDDLQGMVYALGTTPVLRMRLADPEKFDGKLLDLLSQYEVTWEAKRAGGQSFRVLQIPMQHDEPQLRVVQLYHRGDLVLSVSAEGQAAALVPWLIGHHPPAQRLAQSKRLNDLLKGVLKGQTRYVVGALNAGGLVKAVQAKHPHPDFASDVLRAQSKKNPNAVGRVDQGMAQATLVTSLFGESTMVGDISSAGVMTTRLDQGLSPMLKSVAALGVAIPGPQTMENMRFDLSLGVDLARLSRDLPKELQAHIDEQAKAGMVTTKSYDPHARDGHGDGHGKDHAGTPEAGQKQPLIKLPKAGFIPPMVTQHLGARISLLDVNLKAESIFSLIGSLKLIVVIGSKNPDVLMQMAGQMRPLARALSGLEVPSDGTPVSLDGRVPLPGAYIAKTDRALALSFGPGSAEKMTQWLTAKPVANPPIMSLSMDQTLITDGIKRLLSEMSKKMSAQPRVSASQKAQKEMLEELSESAVFMGSTSMTLRSSERGLTMEMTQDVKELLTPEQSSD
jgi:hypothetical protein